MDTGCGHHLKGVALLTTSLAGQFDTIVNKAPPLNFPDLTLIGPSIDEQSPDRFQIGVASIGIHTLCLTITASYTTCPDARSKD